MKVDKKYQDEEADADEITFSFIDSFSMALLELRM